MKPNIPNQKKSYDALNSRLVKYMAQVQSIYDRIATQVANAVDSVGYDGSVEFLFANYPELNNIVNNIMSGYAAQMNNLIYSGTSSEWKESNIMQDLLARKVLRAYDFEKGGDKYNRYFQPNSEALKTFQMRTDNGMNLSQKLWVQSEGLKKELEQTISTAIDKGQSAVVLSKRISKYLSNFPSMKSDYTEKYGKAVSCRDCQYASIRLARTEINMAYREAEQLRWRQFDFILGYEVKLSKRHPAPDICNDLIGKYPKDFKFVGWHPNCMCYVVPIVMSDEEYYGGEDVQKSAKIERTPKSFNDWVRTNRMRIGQTTNLPYFLKDNRKYWHLSPEDAARYRHADRNEKAIRIAARNRELLQYGSSVDDSDIASLRRNAKAYGVNISELEKYISSHKFEESFDLMTSRQENILFGMVSKYNAQVMRAAAEFGKYKKGLLDKFDYSYDFGEWKSDVAARFANIRPTQFTPVKDLRAKVKQTYENARAELQELRTIPIKPKKLIEDFDDFELEFALNDKEAFMNAQKIMQNCYGKNLDFNPIWTRVGSAAQTNGFGKGFQVFLEEYNEGLKEVLEAVNHLNELRSVDLNIIPKNWIPRFNDYIKTIESAKIDVRGYNRVYREIEGAYNIYKLASDKELVEYGLNRLSFNTPYTIVEGFREIGISPTKWLGKKEFYDSFDKFVPCINLGGDSAYFTSKHKHVRIDFAGDKERFAESIWYRKGSQYHEFGHAKAALQGGRWEDKKEWSDLFKKFYDDYNQDGNFYESVDAYGKKITRWKIADKYWEVDFKHGFPNNKDTIEPFGAISDTLQALSKDKAFVGYCGHNVDYFLNSEHLCKAEIIAHLSENYWLGNKYFQMVLPRFYNEAMALYEKFYKANLPKKR